MSETRIPLCIPHLGGNEARYLQECVETNFVSSVGPFVGRFEREFAAFVGSQHAVACSTGTAALHVALQVAGVGPGDEVFVSDFTFVATVNPILYLGAIPVLVDADFESWNLDPRLVVDELKRRQRAGSAMPKAVLVAHILGLPANIEPIAAACERFGITLIEDAAEALGASYVGGVFSGRQVGTIGRLGCFSFNGNKVMTTGGGGMIVTADDALARRARHLTTQARLPGLEYRHDEVGYNYRLTNIQAALGVAQLEQLDGFLAKKKAIAARYREGLESVTALSFPPEPPWSEASAWLSTIMIASAFPQGARAEITDKLLERGVDSRPVWTPIHSMPLYVGFQTLGGVVGETVFANGITLPSGVSLTDDEQRRVIDAVRVTVDGAGFSGG